jgi:hypothetical protein
MAGKRKCLAPEDNIGTDLKETVCDSEDWSHVAQDRGQQLVHMNMMIHLWAP